MNTATLVWCVVQVTLFAVVAGVLYLMARRLHASLGSIIASVSLALVLVLTALAASPWPRWEWQTQDRTAEATSAVANSTADVAEVATIPVEPGTAPTVDDSTPSPALAAWSAFTQALAEPPPTAEDPGSASLSFSWRTAARWVLVICLVIGVARFTWGVWIVRRLVAESHKLREDDTATLTLLDQLQKSLGITSQVQLRESPTIATPATVGSWRPTILLPERWREWTHKELQAVLAHELAHIAARDYRSWLVARLAVAVHFYHPLVHWLAGRLQMEQELAADAIAVRLVGDRQSYLHSLASLALATPNHRLSGPARTLIPGRSLLMRRVEMLREAKERTSGKSTSPLTRATAAVSLAMIAVAVAGVRQVANGQDAPGAVAEESTTPTTSPGDIPRIGLEVVPDNTIFALSVRPAELLHQPDYEELTQKFDELVPDELKRSGVSVADLAEVMVIFYGSPGGQPRLAIRFNTPESCNAFADAIAEDMKKSRGFEVSIPNVLKTDNARLTKIDERTIVHDRFRSMETSPVLPPAVSSPLGWVDQWKQSEDKQLVLALDMNRFRTQMSPQHQEQLVGGFPMQMFAPLLENTEWGVVSVDAIGGLKLAAQVQCHNDEAAGSVAATGRAALTLLGNLAAQQRNAAMTGGPLAIVTLQQRATVDALYDLVNEFTTDTAIATEGDQVTLAFTSQKMDAAKIAITTGFLIPALEASREAARRTQSANNMKQLMLALHNYHDVYNHFPPAVVYEQLPGGKRVARSWRVEILPYLERADMGLAQEYRKDEPWDSEANLKVLAKMPEMFRSPSDDPSSTNTSYFAITGPETVFHDEKGGRFAQITDGTSNTIALVESKQDVPWTKPEDIVYESDTPLPKLQGWHPGIFLAGIADGSVRAISQDIDEPTLRWMFERADGNPIPR